MFVKIIKVKEEFLLFANASGDEIKLHKYSSASVLNLFLENNNIKTDIESDYVLNELKVDKNYIVKRTVNQNIKNFIIDQIQQNAMYDLGAFRSIIIDYLSPDLKKRSTIDILARPTLLMKNLVDNNFFDDTIGMWSTDFKISRAKRKPVLVGYITQLEQIVISLKESTTKSQKIKYHIEMERMLKKEKSIKQHLFNLTPQTDY